jgi:hypothetical protein
MVGRYGIIENGVVVNTTVAELEFAVSQGWVPIPDGVGPGWLYDGTTFSPPPEPPPAPVPVPASITRRQCALQLLAMQMATPQEALDMTKSAEVPAAVAQVFSQMPDDQRILAQIDFAAANYYRDNQLLTMMGLTDEEIDQFFIAAAQL